MTITSKSTIKTHFTTGATPSQQNFTDFIDSFLGIGETASQTIPSDVVVSGNTSMYGTATLGAVAQTSWQTALGLGTAAFLNTGVSANNVPKLDASNRLPAVDGSLLTNLPGTLVQIGATQVAAAAAFVDFTTGINSTYAHYIFEISNYVPSTNAALQAQFYQTTLITSSNYSYATNETNSAGTQVSTGAETGSIMAITGGNIDTTTPAEFIVHMFQPNLAVRPSIFWTGTYGNTGAGFKCRSTIGSGNLNVAAATTGIRFLPASGTFSGTFKLYGV